MSRHQYRLHEYFDQLDKREEITEAELRTLVDRVAEESTLTSTSLYHGGILMKTALVLCAFLVGGGTFWYTYYGHGAQETTLPFHPIVQNSTEGVINDGDIAPPQTLQAPGNPLVEGKDRSTSASSTIQKESSQVQPGTPSLQRLHKAPWGYRFQPEQKLWYEYRTTEINPVNGDTSVLIKQAMIEVESVERNGNITVLLTTTKLAKQESQYQVETTYSSSTNTGSPQQYRATITPLGEFIDGSIIDDPREKEWLEETNTPNFGGALRSLPSKEVELEISQWLPRWPAKHSFNNRYHVHKNYHAYETNTWTDTLHALTNDITNDPSRHLDTLGNTILYVSARARGIEQNLTVEQKEELEERPLQTTSSITNERSTNTELTEINPQITRTQKQSTYTYQPKTSIEPSQVDHQIVYNRSLYRYKLDSSSLARTSESMYFITSTDIDTKFEQENLQKLEQWKGAGELTFRRSDGAVLTQSIEGKSFERHQESYGKSLMNRNERNMASSTSLRLIRSEMPERTPDIESPSSPSIE